MELKPCPFCGSPGVLIDKRLGWVVECANFDHKCGVVVIGERAPEPQSRKHAAAINWDHFEQNAVDRWNRRASVGLPPELVERLRALNGLDSWETMDALRRDILREVGAE